MDSIAGMSQEQELTSGGDLERMMANIIEMVDELKEMGGMPEAIYTNEGNISQIPWTANAGQLQAMIHQLKKFPQNLLTEPPSEKSSVLMMTKDRMKSEVDDLNSCYKIQSNYISDMKREIEMSELMLGDMKRLHGGMVEANSVAEEEQVSEESSSFAVDLDSLKAIRHQLELDLTYVLDNYLPNEKEKIFEIISLLQAGSHTKKGWVKCDPEKYEESWGGFNLLNECALIIQDPKKVNKFKLALTDDIMLDK